VNVEVADSHFEDLFHVAYVVRFRDRRRAEVCVPRGVLRGDISESVLLRASTTDVGGTERFESVVRFERMPMDKEGVIQYLVGVPLAAEVTSPDSQGGHVVPAGSYRVVVRYRAGRCHERAFWETCVAASESFMLDKATRYVIER